MRLVAAAALGLLAAACAHRPPARPALAPLRGESEGEVHVYLEPFPRDAERLTLEFAEVALTRADGTAVPLEVVLPEASGPTARGQRRLAWARVPPGQYRGLTIRIGRATLTSEGQAADLLASKEAIPVESSFTLRPGRALMVSLHLREGQALDPEQAFAVPFTAVARGPESGVVQLSGYAAMPTGAALVAFDRRARRVTAVLPVGGTPQAVAVDAAAGRAYVSLGAEDQIEVLDLASGEPLQRINLRSGDDPGELAFGADGRTLVVVARGGNAVLFLDVSSASLLERVQVAEGPEALLLDSGGRRAYVLSRRTATLTVVDLGNRAVAATARTDAEPLRAQLNRAGNRLYVVHRGSAYMTAYSVPDLAVLSRSYVGLGASTLKIDPRTDLLYVGRADAPRVEVYEPFSLVAIDAIEVPGPVSALALDPLEGTLLVVSPSKGAVAAADLASRKVRAVLEVGREPGRLALVGERN